MIFYFPYGGTGTIYFPLQGSATAALTALASGSLNGTTVLWNMDGSAWAVTTNTGTVVGSGIYKVALLAGETTGKIGILNIKSSNGIFEDQVVIYQTYGNVSAAVPFNLGTNEVILRASQATATIGTVLFVATGTVTTVINTVVASVTGTPVVDVTKWLGTAANGSAGTPQVNLVANQSTSTIGTVLVLINGTVSTVTGLGTLPVNVTQWKGTAVAGTDGTAIVNLVANQSTATIGTVSFLASGTVNTVLNSVTSTITGTPAVNAVLFLGTAIVGTQGTLTNIGTAGTALGTVTATVVGTPAVDAVKFLGTAIVGTQGTLTNIGTAGTALGTVTATVTYLTSARAELSAVPSPTADIGTKIDFLYMISLNPLIQGSGSTSTLTLRNNADTGSIGTRTVTDDGSTLKSAKWA